ncbi:GRIP domain containing protein RUD3 [Dissostichus eleginoides]|uniref:GRIP domain containing protein RUD3 n=1 Tax=Dissostichus eleginoides TaxID=100907 RepID=A0AAD9BLG9_DISEL|nr:GRIP domain containing protein RUD3 [Dissostichus eleginoides]
MSVSSRASLPLAPMEMAADLQAIGSQLQTLQRRILNHRRNFHDRDTLGEMYDSIVAEEKATRSKCSVLQREVRELSEKLSNRSTVNVKFNEMKAKIEETHVEKQNLEKELKYLEKQDENSEELRAEYKAELQILVQKEKDLCKIQDEVKEATKGLTCKTDLQLKDVLHLEEVHERVLVLEETNKMAEFEREEIKLQNDDLESRIQDLQIWIQKEKDFCEIHDSTKETQEELKCQNRVLMEKFRVCRKKKWR